VAETDAYSVGDNHLSSCCIIVRESIPVIGTQIPGKREFEISFPGIPGMTGVTPGSHSDHEETCLKCSSSVVRRYFFIGPIEDVEVDADGCDCESSGFFIFMVFSAMNAFKIFMQAFR